MTLDIFQAIADPTRRKILYLTSLKAMTPGDLAENFNTSRQAVSKHIRILSDSRLLEQEQIGREIFYRIKPDRLKQIDKWLEPFRAMWEERFTELEKILNTQTKQRRKQDGVRKRSEEKEN